MKSLVIDVQENEHIDDVKAKAQNYISTIKAAQSFISVVTWKDDHVIDSANYSVGRTMTTSANNKLAPKIDVTPDIVIQVHKDLGYVVEIKRSLPQDPEKWLSIFEQIIKYDDNLSGWWESSSNVMENSNVVFLVHQSRSIKFVKQFEQYLANKNLSFTHRFAVVEFAQSDEVNQYYHMRIQYGSIQPDEINGRLLESIQVPIDKVLKTYNQLKFFDCEPPCVEYTMGILWQNIFLNLPRENYDEVLKGYPVTVDIDDVTEELQKSYGHIHGDGHRNVEFPQKGWVEKAMDAFVNIKMAKKISDLEYVVILKPISTDLTEFFSRRLYKISGQKRITQLTLF